MSSLCSSRVANECPAKLSHVNEFFILFLLHRQYREPPERSKPAGHGAQEIALYCSFCI